jgi:hypothetical protein
MALTICSILAPSASRAQDGGHGAIRLHVHTSSPVVPLGSEVDVTIALRDVAGGSARAPHALEVDLYVDGGPQTEVVFQPGETEVNVSVSPRQEGILELRAEGREVLPGSCFVKVTPPESRLLLPGQRGRSPTSLAAVAARPRGIVAATTARAQPGGGTGAPSDAAIVLKFSAMRALATGHDAIRIRAYTVGAPMHAPADLPLVHTGFGTLSYADAQDRPQAGPPALHFDAGGQASNVLVLASSEPGTECVEYLGSLEVRERRTCVEFEPPVVGLTVTAYPNRLTLLDNGSVTIVLRGSDPMSAVHTVVDRTITLRAEGRGGGNLSSRRVLIPAGQISGEVTFEPTSRGDLMILASTDGLVDTGTSVTVTYPVLKSLLTLLGGAIGGLLATYGNRWRWKRVLVRATVGVATGAVLYWFALWGMPVLSAAWRVNPVSALFVACLGGYVGTKVIELVANRLGIIDAQAPAAKRSVPTR